MYGLKHQILSEFGYDENDNFTEYVIEHYAIWLNSDEKIESYNKIYLPHSSTSLLLNSEARVINPNGKIEVLDASNILTAVDDETNRQYKYFAFEGVEKGSIIEYYYTIQRNPKYMGNKITLQSSFGKENVQFDLYAPKHLVFDFKSYNGLPEVSQDTTMTQMLHWEIDAKHIAALEEEELSAYDASREFLIYKLDKNLNNSTYDISSYGNISQNLYKYYYGEQSKKVGKQLEKLTKQASVANLSGELDELKKLEYFIKSEFYISEGAGDELSNLEEILDNKVANETGMIKVYTNLLSQNNVPHELVFTSDRSILKFDDDFEAQNFLTDVLIYFPELDTYLSPTEQGSRIGFPPAFLTDNYGLFIKEMKMGDFKSGLGSVKFIEPLGPEKTLDEMDIHVKFGEEDPTIVYIDMEKRMSGYYAMFIQPFMNMINKENRDELVESFAKSMNEDIDVTKKKIVNDDPFLFGTEPLTFQIEANSDAFIEKAGSRLLFNVGALIGKQIQMYQEKKRVLPLENQFTRAYNRTIIVEIPEGYEVTNLEDLTIKNSYSEEGKEVFLFDSFYKLDGDKLTITANEFYAKNMVETENFDEYRKIINSAADFNKVTLILQPKG
ncbi:hypothetical protein DHD80_06645 [Gramella sp. AN32]|nr:hypothetical protein [Gramella sp. AN32]